MVRAGLEGRPGSSGKRRWEGGEAATYELCGWTTLGGVDSMGERVHVVRR